jgi:hypothetical protein
MGLESQFFRGDPKLQAAAVSDPAHIVLGASGEHVRKIQLALIQLDGAAIDPDGKYGPMTGNAVLAYKQKRKIINRSYQTQADNIVGRMTMASLDQEMLAKERARRGPSRLEPVFPAPRSYLAPARAGPMLGFQMSGFPGLFETLPVNEAIVTAPPARSMEIPLHGSKQVLVLNGKDRTISVGKSWIAGIVDPPTGRVFSTLRVTEDPQIIRVQAKDPGRTEVFTMFQRENPASRIDTWVGLFPREVKIAFHFLGGPSGVATTRGRNGIDAAIETIKSIYEDQTHITFSSGGIFGPIVVPELAQKAVLSLARTKRTDDWIAVVKKRSAATFNVFFACKIEVVDTLFKNQAVALTDKPGSSTFLNRDCIMQDDLKGVDLGLALAHEAAHALGEDDNNAEGDVRNVSAPGRKIPIDAAVRMNKNLVDF